MKIFTLIIICLFVSSICFARDINGLISNKRGFVFQALNGGALGYICPKWALDQEDCKIGQLVYFDFNFDFIDNQMFTLPKNYSFYAEGVYKYTNKDNVLKTVRKVSLISQ